jgi:hypothetical protein
MRLREDLTASVNIKGVVDVDTVKGCTCGMKAYPDGGCYGLCYAANAWRRRGLDFTKSVCRYPRADGIKEIIKILKQHPAKWFRVGTMGDPCHFWELTASVCEWFCKYKVPVIVTKHWIPIQDKELKRLQKAKATVNTSVSALDTDEELSHRLEQHARMKAAGLNAVLRVVSAKFGDTELGRLRTKTQDRLYRFGGKVIDNPLRIPATDARVRSGEIIVKKVMDLNAEVYCSIAREGAFTGKCSECPDQCGVESEET